MRMIAINTPTKEPMTIPAIAPFDNRAWLGPWELGVKDEV